MTTTADNLTAKAAQEPPEPLPWRWFEFCHTPRVLQCPIVDDPHTVHCVRVDGTHVPFKYFRRASTTGKPRPVLTMLHGMGLTIGTFHDVAPYLLATHDLIMPDYSLLSPVIKDAPDAANFKAFAQCVWTIADGLGIERVSLAGNSLGGGLCLMAALMAPQRVDRMVLSNPACFPQELPRGYRIARIPIIGEWMMLTTAPERLVGGVEYIGYVDKSRMPPALRTQYLENFATPRSRLRVMQLMRHLPANAQDTASIPHLRQLGNLHVPVLLSWGVHDPLLVQGAGVRLAQALPNVTYEEYADLSHMPHEEAPHRIGPRWVEFLNQP